MADLTCKQRTILSVCGSDPSLCCLKVDMTNAFNECSRFSFLACCRSSCPDILAWVEWGYCCAGELWFGPHHILSTTGVQQVDPLGPLLFSLILLDFLSHSPTLDGLAFQLWYLDDGILVGTHSALSSFLCFLQQQGPANGLHPNLSKYKVFWPSGDQSFSIFPLEVQPVALSDAHGVCFFGLPYLWFSHLFFLLCGFHC